jgi:hypothetical protein
MQRKMATALVVGLALVLVAYTAAYAWQGDSWGPISRTTIYDIAWGMVSTVWIPKNTIINWEHDDEYQQYNIRSQYIGVAYSQETPQENLSEFRTAVQNTPPGTTYYGNDCSGFVSIAWKLPVRYATTHFESDATSAGGYVTSRGNIGSAQQTILLPGDALVKSGDHMVLFHERTQGGIRTMEQTPHRATRIPRKWSELKEYRPIRRNAMDETLYTGTLPSTASVVYYPNSNGYNSTVSGTHFAWFGGPNDYPNTVFYLYLYKWNVDKAEWQRVASGASALSSAKIAYPGTPGKYIWQVISYRGSGNYELAVKVP